ncbi:MULTISPECIES: hypothetical protein [Arthrospira]|uniref:Uncharacterized protein n=1 Tax=Limnospira platensis NIES-46 TaxID=1236695 RepID=A0A5M3TAH7_LIMPL|nr:hypothetical protein [Arthrospira platensis]AMW26935.1 hypothetical protein AP285_01915 [Arthrospira platensis YZ]KDR54596.1 hypothetical protein APPUASWS_027285 [Arthrospira platensis str. Paraca]MBD2669895.1 hypothetical protein [Arthrospira platensis FACHB-439]MBD2710429.1 hypothetical protein [Arthrospira platensis FACHB-835]MDF2211673.1 hypothetical protein [Arthrospira platensis NCB002]MDT9183305.1 hypothetical protein [Limnospira sp. PMC 289.06]MDT9297053.1 hypothetical protein [Ar
MITGIVNRDFEPIIPLSVSFDYDLNPIFEDLRQKEAESGREVVNLSRQPGLKNRWSQPSLEGEREETYPPR